MAYLMMDLGLTKEEMRWFYKAILGSCEVFVNVEIWDRGRNHRATVNWTEITGPNGQVNIDATSTAGRGATITVPDPDGKLHVDTNVLFLDRMLRIGWWVWIPEMLRWVKVPIFTGPINKADAIENGTLQLEAQGKELWLRGRIKDSRTWRKGTPVTTVIRQILLTGGEVPRYIDVPDRGDRLPDSFEIGPHSISYWTACKYLANSIDCDIFYDGASTCVLRPSTTQAVFSFEDGADGAMIAQPQLSTAVGGADASPGDLSMLKNEVIVHGYQKPGGDPVEGYWVAPHGTRFAPLSIGNEGAPWYLTDEYSNDHIRLKSTANRIARARGRRHMQVAEQISIVSAVIPHLDPYDQLRYHAASGGGGFELLQASIPLRFEGLSAPMTIGFVDSVSAPPQGVRHR